MITVHLSKLMSQIGDGTMSGWSSLLFGLYDRLFCFEESPLWYLQVYFSSGRRIFEHFTAYAGNFASNIFSTSSVAVKSAQIEFSRALHSNNIFIFLPCATPCPTHPSVLQILTYNRCARDIGINYTLIALLQFAVCAQGMSVPIIILSTMYLWLFQVVLCLAVGCIGVSVVWSAQMGILLHSSRGRQAAAQHAPANTICGHSPGATATAAASATAAAGEARAAAAAARRARRLRAAAVACGAAAWAYYAATAEPITTAAHLCAFAMGVAVDAVAQRFEPPPPPLPLPPPA
jgi:hypothetical protein